MERFSFVKGKCSYSEIFKTFILREWEFNSISELSRKFQVSQSKIYSVINTVTISELEKEKTKYMISCKEIII
jgi:Mor family transcriptional regulator